MTKIPIAKPLFGPEELAAVAGPLESGWVVQGPYVAEFEKRFARYTAAKHAVAVSNGTTALHLAQAALRLGPGDEVIVPAFTWIATPNSVVYCGATPVFCDIDLATYNVDAAQLERHVTPRTRGLLPVHLFGLTAELDPVLDLARARNLWVVEDAACAFGSTYHGQHAGTFGDANSFSFHPRKSITTGEGGMVTTANDDVAKVLRSMRDHGVGERHDEPSFLLPDFDELGFNYRLTDIQGAIGCAQMDRADVILAGRRRVARRYDEELANLGWLRTPYVPPSMEHSYQAYVCLFAPEEPSMANVDRLEEGRNALMARLDAAGIITRPGTHAPVLRKAYRDRGIDPAQFPNAVLAERLSFALPLYPQMTEDEQSRVIEMISECG
ncbi:MAG TPA: DegT/DnrJ/EryC1/StrS family aminotransferase [Thermoanaerobaculia bacterium]|jgi:dTDP-4-amino-4,6-dideoxygalactose transaminase